VIGRKSGSGLGMLLRPFDGRGYSGMDHGERGRYWSALLKNGSAEQDSYRFVVAIGDPRRRC
jgi:hypothetical protein